MNHLFENTFSIETRILNTLHTKHIQVCFQYLIACVYYHGTTKEK